RFWWPAIPILSAFSDLILSTLPKDAAGRFVFSSHVRPKHTFFSVDFPPKRYPTKACPSLSQCAGFDPKVSLKPFCRASVSSHLLLPAIAFVFSQSTAKQSRPTTLTPSHFFSRNSIFILWAKAAITTPTKNSALM